MRNRGEDKEGDIDTVSEDTAGREGKRMGHSLEEVRSSARIFVFLEADCLLKGLLR